MDSQISKFIRLYAEYLELFNVKAVTRICLQYINEYNCSIEDAITCAAIAFFMQRSQSSLEQPEVAYILWMNVDDLVTTLTDVFPELDSEIRKYNRRSMSEKKNLSIKNKKGLYESIMRDVSKIVKSHLTK